MCIYVLILKILYPNVEASSPYPSNSPREPLYYNYGLSNTVRVLSNSLCLPDAFNILISVTVQMGTTQRGGTEKVYDLSAISVL